MQQASNKPNPIKETLPALMPYKETLRLFEQNVYGPIPILSDVVIVEKKQIAREAFTENDTVWQWKVVAGYGSEKRVFHIVFISKEETENSPYIIAQNFCPNTATVPIDGITAPNNAHFDCSQGGMIGSIFGYFFGRYITVSPYKMILDRGYNIALFYPSEFVPDSQSEAPVVTSELFEHSESKPANLAIWASLSNWLAEEIKTANPRRPVISYGHSRFGKTALLSAATSPYIDGVIAHQSGTGGASILRDGTGESIKDVTGSYAHWFTPKFSTFAGKENTLPIDAHNLLSLIAPKPILLGNARRDVWSDPEGAFDAAVAATPVWRKVGLSGLTAKRLDHFIPEDDIAFWMRPGTHGVVKEDWPAFLDFLDAHFGGSISPQ